MKRIAIIMPVYNESQVVSKTIKSLDLLKWKNICVDDGSIDGSFSKMINTGAHVIKHPINLGQGAALQTGIEYALQDSDIEYFVTFDSDGQHSVSDVKSMLKLIKTEDLDIVLGSRFLGLAQNIKLSKKMLLKAAIKFTNTFSGVKLTDTHNGLRVFNRRFAESLQITMPDMAHASEIIDSIGSGDWKYKEVPITIKYTEYSMAKGQSIFNSVNILFDLFLSKLGRKK